jgi:hypothetical protein
MFSRYLPPLGLGWSALTPPWSKAMCARFTVLSDTPIAATIAGWIISLSRSKTI